MKKFGFFSALGVILFSAYLFFNVYGKHQTIKSPISFEAQEESQKKKQMEIDMLADPSTGMIPDGVRAMELEFLKNFKSSQNKTTSSNWSQRGPWNVGGRTRALAMDVTNENILVAAGVSGLIYRSTDAGASWEPTLGLMDHQGIVSIAQDTRSGKENIWYALGGEATGASQAAPGAYYFGDGLFKSVDSAKSWTPISSTNIGTPTSYNNFFQTGWRVATSPRINKDIVYVCSIYGIRRSDDGGNNWTYAMGDFANPYNYYTDIDISDNGVVYATLSGEDPQHKGIYRSDNDVTYTKITPTNFINNYGRIALDINPNNTDEVYFLVYMDDSTGNPAAVPTTNYQGDTEYVALLKYTYLSGDGSGTGGMWENLSSKLPTTTGGPFDKINCQGGYDMVVKVQPQTNNVYIGGTNLYLSTDGFTSPNNTHFIGGYLPQTVLPFFEIYPIHHPDQHDVIFSPSDTNIVYSASDGGVRRTNDVYASIVPWENLNGGFFTSQYYTVTIDQATSGSDYLLGGFQDNGNFITNTLNLQHQWVLPFNGDGAYNYIAPNRDFYVMSIQLGKMIKAELDNDGNLLNFERIDPVGPGDPDYLFINPYVVDPNDNNFLYLPAGDKLYRQDSLTYISYNNNYQKTTRGWKVLLDSFLANQYISAIAISKNPANILYIGTNAGRMYKIENANSSNPIVTDITSGLYPGYIQCIAIDEEDASKVGVVFSNYNVPSIYYSEDAGGTWGRAGGNLETGDFGYPPSVRWMSICNLPDGSKKYLVGTSIGLFSSDSIKTGLPIVSQTTWQREGENEIGAAIIRHMTWRSSDGYAVVGTHGRGAFAANLGTPNSVKKPTSSPINIYPNPSQGEVTMVIASSANTARLEIYNCLGQLVLLRDHMPIHNKKVQINVSELANSYYFAVIRTENQIYESSFRKN